MMPLRCTLLAISLVGSGSAAEWQMESLDRGLVAVQRADDGVFLSWRLLGHETDRVAFNVYRVGDDETVKLNEKPLTGATSFMHKAARAARGDRYFVRAAKGEVEQDRSRAVVVWPNNYLEIPIQPIDGYLPGDASVGDLDGDGRYEIVLHSGFLVPETTPTQVSLVRQFWMPIRLTENTCGGSTWARTFARVNTTRSLWSTTWMEMVVRRWRAKPLTVLWMAKELLSAMPPKTIAIRIDSIDGTGAFLTALSISRSSMD